MDTTSNKSQEETPKPANTLKKQWLALNSYLTLNTQSIYAVTQGKDNI